MPEPDHKTVQASQVKTIRNAHLMQNEKLMLLEVEAADGSTRYFSIPISQLTRLVECCAGALVAFEAAMTTTTIMTAADIQFGNDTKTGTPVMIARLPVTFQPPGQGTPAVQAALSFAVQPKTIAALLAQLSAYMAQSPGNSPGSPPPH